MLEGPEVRRIKVWEGIKLKMDTRGGNKFKLFISVIHIYQDISMQYNSTVNPQFTHGIPGPEPMGPRGSSLLMSSSLGDLHSNYNDICNFDRIQPIASRESGKLISISKMVAMIAERSSSIHFGQAPPSSSPPITTSPTERA
jgi:hypothetical protein